MDAQTTHIIALESLLREKAMESEELQKVKRQNEELQEVRPIATMYLCL